MDSDATTPAAPPEETRYGSFVIVRDVAGEPRLLGQGTFGKTFLARHEYLNTFAALKVITERFATQHSARERFLSEGRALVRLDHRHIARLHDFGEARGALFYAMEYCAGGDLAALVNNSGALPLADWLEVAQQLARALECCHAAGFIHRDIKPSNIMLARSDGPLVTKLIDFGLVQAELTSAMSDTHLVGTPLYASPEQLREESIDGRSDLFSLGMTFWHLALGAPPESGNSAKIIASRLSAEGYAELLPGHLPAAVRSVLTRLLEKDRSRRTASAAELSRQLAEAARALGLRATGAELVPASSPSVTALEIEEVDADLATEFDVEGTVCEQKTGANHLATRRGRVDERVMLHSLHPHLVKDELLIEKLRAAAGGVRALQAPFTILPLSMRSYRNATVLVTEAPAGESLLAALTTRGKCSITETFQLLERIATASDLHISAGLPGVELAAARIYLKPPGLAQRRELQPELLPRFLLAKDTPELRDPALSDDDALAASVTRNHFEEGEAADHAPRQFARLVYRIAAGRDCAAAAAFSPRAYSPVPELSDETNRLLSGVISGESEQATCAALLAELAAAEGVRTRAGSSTKTPKGLPVVGGSTSRVAAASAAAGSAITARVSSSAPPALTHPSAMATAPFSTRASPPSWRRRVPLLAGCGFLICLIVAGLHFASKGRRAAGNNAADFTPPLDVLPPDAAAALVGDFPSQCTFEVDGSPIQPRLASGSGEVPLGGKTLPVEVRVKARGFRDVVCQITGREQLESPQSVSFGRNKGTLVLRRRATSDYSRASVRMEEALPAEEGFVPLERVTRSKGIINEEERLELPSGKWVVTLEGNNGRVVRPRVLQRVEIEDNSERECVLPMSFAGVFKGGLRDPDGVAATELVIEPGLTEGSFSDTRGGVARRARLEGCRVDGAGAFSALVKFSHSPTAPAYDEQITATLANETGDLTVKIFEVLTDGESVKKQMKRAPFAEDDWSRTGMLKRSR